jgi:capsular exopolysaccharide synthesis family protein
MKLLDLWPFRRSVLPVEPGAEGQDFLVVVDDTVDPRLVVYQEPASNHAEQYRSFRTNLRAMNPGDEPRTLLFTSSQPREGKSVTVANIALAMAESEALSVCLVDGDMRAGRLHRLFGLKPGPGLTDVLLDGVPPRAALQTSPVPNLSVISAGRLIENPGEIFGSDYIQELIAWLKRRHQYVFFDSPPCLSFADAAELAKVTDGVVLVVAISETTKADAERALASLEAVGANVVGSFVTGAEPLEQAEATEALDVSLGESV